MRVAPVNSPSSPRPRRTAALLAATLLGGAALTACSSEGGADTAGGTIRIVTSTTVYSDIARMVAGADATVEAVITDPTADPHSFEAGPADAARVADADLVVYNGAGYDAFVDRALASTDGTPVVRAVDEFDRVTATAVPGHDHGHEGEKGHDHSVNEHVWFHLPTVSAVAERVADELADLDPGNAQAYRDNARGLTDGISALEESVDAIHDRGHFSYAQTEPIGAHLFEMAHMHDETPRGFLAAIEDDTDPAAADLTGVLDLLRGGKVDFLAFNTQTETAVTARVRDTAVEADVPVVELAETLPVGTDYLTWMTGIVTDLSDALEGVEAAPAEHDNAPTEHGSATAGGH